MCFFTIFNSAKFKILYLKTCGPYLVYKHIRTHETLTYPVLNFFTVLYSYYMYHQTQREVPSWTKQDKECQEVSPLEICPVLGSKATGDLKK